MKEVADKLDASVANGQMTMAERAIAMEEAISENAHRAWISVARKNRLFYRREKVG